MDDKFCMREKHICTNDINNNKEIKIFYTNSDFLYIFSSFHLHLHFLKMFYKEAAILLKYVYDGN